MSEEQQSTHNKRKRTPSQYATHIQDFKNNTSSIQKKTKNTRFAQPPVFHQENKKYSTKSIPCILPNGRQYSLQIVVNAQQTTNKKTERKEENISKAKPVEQKKDDNTCLLYKLLSAVQNLKKEEEQDSKQNHQISRQNKEVKVLIKEERTRRQKEPQQKWNKCYERYKDLGQRLEALEKTYMFLI